MYFQETDRLEIRTKFEFQKFTELIESRIQHLIIYVKLVILTTKNKSINHLKQISNDFKIQLAR